MENIRTVLFFILRQAAYGLLFLLTLILLLLYSFRFPVIQNKILPYVRAELQKSLGTRVEIGSVDIALWDYLIIRDFVMYDTYGQKFMAARKVKISLINTSIPGWLGTVGSSKFITLRDLELDEGYFNLYRRSEDLKLNMFFLSGEKQDTTPSGPPGITIRADNIRIFNAAFNYLDSTKGPEHFGNRDYLNFIHLSLDSIYGDLSFEMDPRGNLQADIRTLSARDTWSGFTLDTFQSQFSSGISVQDKEMRLFNADSGRFTTYYCYEESPFVFLDNTLIASMGSRIVADLRLPGQTLEVLLDEHLQEDWLAVFRESRVDFRFVNSFSPYKLPFAQPVLFSGKVTGVVNRLKGKDITVKLMDSTFLSGNIRFDNLVEGGETLMELDIPECRFMASEVQAFIPTLPLPSYLMNASDVRLTGAFTGLFSDFVVQARVLTPQGDANLNAHLNLNAEPMAWQGTLEAVHLNLDKVLGGAPGISSDLTLSADFEGAGDGIKNLRGAVQVEIVQSELGGYYLDSVRTIATIADQQISGPLDVRDKDMGDIHLQTEIDFRDTLPAYSILGDLQKIDLQGLSLTTLPMRFSSFVNVHLQGNSLENLEGVVRLFDTRLVKNNRDTLGLDNFQVRAGHDNKQGKWIKLRSETMTMDLATDRSFTRSAGILSRIVKEAGLFFQNNDSLTNAYYAGVSPDSIGATFSLVAEFEESNGILDFFETGLFLSADTRFELDLSTGKTDIIQINLTSSDIRYGETTLQNVNLEGSIYKDARSPDILAQADIKAREVSLGEGLSFQQVELEPVWYNETIEFELNAVQQAYQNRIRLFGNTEFRDKSIRTLIGSNNSTLLLNRDLWTFKGKNEVTYYNRTGSIVMNDIHLTDSTGQSLAVYGDISKENSEGLVVKLENVKLSTINQLAGSGEELEGLVNAQLMLSDLMQDPYVQGFAFVKGFGFRKLQYGDVEANAVWNQSSETLSLDCSLQKDGKKLLAMTGQYAIRDTISPMNFKLASYDLPLNLAEPFMEGYVYEVKGTVELNEFNARGTFEKPIITGTGYFKDVSFVVDYTKTRYKFTGNIRFNDRNINFLDIRLFDDRAVSNKQNYALLSGYIYHQGFRDFRFNIELESIRNFMVFNTREEDNDLFYGKMIIRDGVASIDGDLNTIRLTTFVETGAGTLLNIPLTDYTEGSSLDFVSFVSDQVEQEISDKLDLTGFELKITVNATPDATVRIIFDERTGEIIEAQGNGNIDLLITPEGEFSMRGSYEIEKGDYLFTLQNGTFNKRFFIDKGGRITWTGSPYEAQLDLNAYYLVYANIADLMGPTASSSRVPVRVLMKMNGSLLSPEIALNLDVQNLNDQSAAEVSSRIKAITADPQQLNNQVFFLLMSSRFAPNLQGAGAGSGSGTGGVTSSVAELVSNQLNYWTSQAFGNNFSANISSNQFQNVNLALQAKLFNDRVTVERNGAITSSANSDVTIGNINVQLKLLPPTRNRDNRRRNLPNPGMLALEAFNREQFGFSGNNSVSRGGGIFFRKDFDRLGELLFPYRPAMGAPPPPEQQMNSFQDSSSIKSE